MQIAVMDLAIDLNDAAEFPSFDRLLEDIECPDLPSLSNGREPEAAATVFADALASAYWTPITKLIDVLIEVVGEKGKQDYQRALDTWNAELEDARAGLSEADCEKRRAKALMVDLNRSLNGLNAELEKSRAQDKLKQQDERLLTEVKQAEADLVEAEATLTVTQKKNDECNSKLLELRNGLTSLGLLAVSKKKALKLEIEALEGEHSQYNRSLESQKEKINQLRSKAGERLEVERRLVSYAKSRTPELESEIRATKRDIDQSNKELQIAQQASLKHELQMKEVRSKRPNKSDYSTEEVEKSLRWRPILPPLSKTPSAKTTAGSPLVKQASAGAKSSAFLKGSGGTWRNRRPLFYDSDPIHINERISTGFSGSEYTATFGCDIQVDDPDMTHRMDIDVEGPSSEFDAANAFLAGASDALRQRSYTGKYAFLRDFKCRRMPFGSIGTRLYVPKLDGDEVADAIGLLAAMNQECPQLRIDGIIEMVKSYAGIRNTYLVTSGAGSSTINVQQKVEGLS